MTNNLLVYIKDSNSFTDELKEKYKDSLVFVENEATLYTHGTKFSVTRTEHYDILAQILKIEEKIIPIIPITATDLDTICY